MVTSGGRIPPPPRGDSVPSRLGVVGGSRLYRDAVLAAFDAEPDLAFAGGGAAVPRVPGGVAVVLVDEDTDEALLDSVPNGVHVIPVRVVGAAGEADIGPDLRLGDLLRMVRSLLVAPQPVPSLHRGGLPGRRRRVLTARELDVLRLISIGHGAAEVADALGITVRGVENAKRRIYDKLGVQTQTHAVADALRRGLLTAPRAGRPGEQKV